MTFKEYLQRECVNDTHCTKENFQSHWGGWYAGLLETSAEYGDEQLLEYIQKWHEAEIREMVQKKLNI